MFTTIIRLIYVKDRVDFQKDSVNVRVSVCMCVYRGGSYGGTAELQHPQNFTRNICIICMFIYLSILVEDI